MDDLYVEMYEIQIYRISYDHKFLSVDYRSCPVCSESNCWEFGSHD